MPMVTHRTVMKEELSAQKTSAEEETDLLKQLENSDPNLRTSLEFDGEENASGVFLQWIDDAVEASAAVQQSDSNDSRKKNEANLETLQVVWNLKHIQTLELCDFPYSDFFISDKNNGKIGNMSTTLTSLTLVRCNELLEIPASIGQLEKLQTLTISMCARIESLPSEIENLQNLQELAIRSNPNLTTLPTQIGSLSSSLTSLSIDNCHNMTRLPKEIGLLRSLERLHMTELPSLEGFPDGFVSSLASLQHWTIKRCTSLTSLANVSIQGLKSLKTVLISGCPRLESIPRALQNIATLKRLNFSIMPRKTILEFFNQPWTGLATPAAIILDGGMNNGWNDDDRTNSVERERSVLGVEHYASILPGLPESLEKLSMEGQNIHTLSGFLPTKETKTAKLPFGLKTLWLADNPVLHSDNERDQKSVGQLLQAYPQLGELCFQLRPNVLTDNTQYLMYLNRCGRVLLQGNTTKRSIPISVWPLVLSRVKRGVEGLHHESTRMEASVLYTFLQGPALLDRQDGYPVVASKTMTRRKRKALDR